MIKRIISGGQTGGDRGGLWAARDLVLELGGWAPKGFRAEDGKVPLLFRGHMREHESADYPPRTRANIEEADATIIFTKDPPEAGCRLTVRLCEETGTPYLLLKFANGAETELEDEAVKSVRAFLAYVEPETINIAGSRESKAPGIEQAVRRILVRALKETT